MKLPFYTLFAVLSILILSLFLINTLRLKKDNLTSIRAFRILIIWNIIFAIQDGIWGLCDAQVIKSHTVFYFSSLFFHISTVLTTNLWIYFTLNTLSHSIRHSNIIKRLGHLLLIIQTSLLIINFFTPTIFYISEEGKYVTCFLRPLAFYNQYFLYILIGVIALIKIIKEDKVNRKQYFIMELFVIAPVTTGFLQLKYPDAPFYTIGYLIGCTIIYSFVISCDHIISLQNVISKQNQQFEMIKKSEQEQQEVLTSMAGVYDYINYVDLENKTAHQFSYKQSKITTFNLEQDPHTELTREIIKNITQDQKAKFSAFTNLATLNERLMGRKSISIDFLQNNSKWLRTNYIRIGENVNQPIDKVLFAMRDITNDKIRELKTQSENLRQLQTLRSMSEVFNSMHLIELEEDTFIEYSANDNVKKIVAKENYATQAMINVINATAIPAYLKDMLFFTDLTTLPQRMLKKKIISEEFISKNVGWCVASFIAIETTPEGKPQKVLFTTRIIEKEKQKEEKLLIESNTDQLTGFYNRRAYEDSISTYEEEKENDDFVYISIDINGLKIVNDTIGHAAGDEIITGASECMRACFANYGKLYRTGGDEFIAIINANEEKLESLKSEFRQTYENWHGEIVEHLSISVGYVTGKESKNMTLHEIAVLADKRMYEDKNLYYQKSGVDRRGQKEAHITLCNSYTKILKINILEDSFQIINADAKELKKSMGFSNTLSKWISDFGSNNQVHPDDQERFLEQTNFSNIQKHFAAGKDSLIIFYRRKSKKEYKQAMMEIIPTKDNSQSNQSYYLYVKHIDA